VCHSSTQNLTKVTQDADLLISAIGKPEFVTAEMIKPGAIVIDVGINEITGPDGSLRYVGDVDYQACAAISSAITPVPGGIGEDYYQRTLFKSDQSCHAEQRH
jgi:methylenetetrahydrofolate dehydrogenase (NADP+)/methenyltetrahydrofolate cyclohydrolase